MVKRGAIFKCAAGQFLECKRNVNAFQLGATEKCLFANAFNAIGQLDIPKSGATVKSAIVDFSERGREFNAVKIFTFKKCVSSDFRNGISHKKLCHMIAGGKGVGFQNFHAVRNAHLFQKRTLHESARTVA